jgi:dTDP-4-dehydrorhamnose 3,5-epimerase
VIITDTPIADLKIIEPRVFHDDRGYFFESFNKSKFPSSYDGYNWVQDNESKSQKGVLRVGEFAQAKLVRAIVGEIFDIAVDIRPGSPTYGKSFGMILTDTNKKQLLIPRGFAHGFLVLSDEAIFGYKCDNYYSKEHEGGIRYDDGEIDIDWPEINTNYLLSEKDIAQPKFGSHKAYED